MTVALTATEAWLLIAVLTYVERQPPLDTETVAVQKALADLRGWRSALLQTYLRTRSAETPQGAVSIL
jgi:hypothetical protein